MCALLSSTTVLQSGGISTFALGPLYLIAVLVPGLLFYRGLMTGGNRYDTFSRLDKLGAALAGGAISWFLLLAFLRLFGYGPFQIGKPNGLDFLTILFVLVFDMAFAYHLGALIGNLTNKIVGDTVRNFNDQQQPWDYTSTKIRESEVTVVAESFDDPLHGFVARYSSFDDGGDLVLSPVSPGSREDTGENSDRGKNNALYIDRDEIAAVFFHDRDSDGEYGEVLPGGDLPKPSDKQWKRVKEESRVEEADEESRVEEADEISRVESDGEESKNPETE